MKFLFALLAPTLFITYTATSYTITDDYAVKFSTKAAEGTFRGLNGTVVFDADNLEASRFDVWVETATIATGNSGKDKHARGAKWLNAEDNPRISFRSERFERSSVGFIVHGDLSINGVHNNVIIPFTFNDKVFEGTVSVLRKDYDIEGPFLFGGLVGNEIAVTLRVPVE